MMRLISRFIPGAVLLTVLSALSLDKTAFGAPVSPANQLKRAIANASAGRRIIVTVLDTSKAGVTTTQAAYEIDQTSLPDSGGEVSGLYQQTNIVAGVTHRLIEIRTGGVLYVKGDAWQVRHLDSATVNGHRLPLIASKYFNRWFIVPPSSFLKGFVGVPSMDSILNRWLGGYTITRSEPATTINAELVTELKGRVTRVLVAGNTTAPKFPATFYITRSAYPLPFEVVSTGGGPSRQTVIFSKWGPATAVTAPHTTLTLTNK